jgi:DNA-binding winged helix-turn-helix (wHTH) protein
MALLLTFGELELDESRFELRRNGQPVPVQPKVLELIFYLARHRERVVAKQELLAELWRGVSVTEASLTQALSLARRALGDSPEEQQMIRTVRRKGLQFVALPGRRPVSETRLARAAGSTLQETEQEDRRPAQAGDVATLFAVLQCEALEEGGASFPLADVDEVRIVRGSERRAERTPGPTRLLTLSVPGRLMSRRHARLVRTRGPWVLVDDGSRNGTRVNGERIEKRTLEPGDWFECGLALFRFALGRGAGADQGADSRAGGAGVLSSVIPVLSALERELTRIAPTELSVLLSGESGAGKTHAARALHRLSGRSGPLVPLVVGTPEQALGEAFQQARGGALLLERVERLDETRAADLLGSIERAPDVRLFSTSLLSIARLGERLPPELLSRIAGYRVELPPLRERIEDLGALASALLQARGCAATLEVDAARALVRYAWPGNVRELANALEAAATIAGGRAIGAEHLRLSA